MYQVTWQRILALHSGVGIYSIAVIVAAFMLGLGAGSHAGGVASARLAPAAALRAFAFIELGIAAFGALSVDPLLRLAVRARRAAVRAALARGAAARPRPRRAHLPDGHVAPVPGPRDGAQRAPGGRDRRPALRGQPPRRRRRRRPHAVGPDPPVGMRGAVLCAAAANVAAAADRPRGPAAPRRRAATHAEAAAPAPPAESLPLAAWALLYALGGFCALSLEMLWFRLADVALKATSFTFGTVLCVYLLGMAAGTWAGVPVARRVRDPLRAFLRCQAGILVGRAPRCSRSPGCRPRSRRFPTLLEYWSAPRPFNLGADWSAGTLLLLYVAVPAFLYGVPTFLMGLSFAVLQRAVHDDARTSGRKVGLLQAVQHRGLRRRARWSSASARSAGGGPRARCAR